MKANVNRNKMNKSSCSKTEFSFTKLFHFYPNEYLTPKCQQNNPFISQNLQVNMFTYFQKCIQSVYVFKEMTSINESIGRFHRNFNSYANVMKVTVVGAAGM